MATKRKGSFRSDRVTSDNSRIRRDLVRFSIPFSIVDEPPISVHETPINLDRRYWSPDDSPRRRDGVRAHITDRQVFRPYEALKWSRMAFENPLRVYVCQQRKKRREVLFAKKKAGRGRRTSRFHVWTDLSSIIC